VAFVRSARIRRPRHDLTGDVPRLLRREEECRASHLFWLGDIPQRQSRGMRCIVTGSLRTGAVMGVFT
jgi:hypothetical protein